MPGFVDTHRHMWQGALRNILPNGLLSDYSRDILGVRGLMRPEDVRIGDLVTRARRHQRRRDDGARLVAYRQQPRAHRCGHRRTARLGRPRGVRIRRRRAGAGESIPAGHPPPSQTALRVRRPTADARAGRRHEREGVGGRARRRRADLGARRRRLAGLEKALGPDVTYIHCTTFTDGAWKLVAGSGGHISIACPIEMEMGLGVPPIQQSLDHGIRPSLSVDVETEMPGDLFTQMRSVFTLQRMLALNRHARRAQPQPRLLTVRDVVEFATIAGARANHLDRKVGTLTPGKDADVIMLRTDTINVMPFNNAYGAVVLAHGHQQRRHGVHCRQGGEAGRPAGRRRSRSRSGATPNSRATSSSGRPAGRSRACRLPFASRLDRRGAPHPQFHALAVELCCHRRDLSAFASALSDPIPKMPRLNKSIRINSSLRFAAMSETEPFFSFDSSLLP